MDIIHAFILGVVQGVTEFLPISSSGHLLFFHDVLNFDMADSLSFDAALHLGTLLALIWFFWPEVKKILKGFLGSFVKWEVRTDENQKLAWLVILGAIPAGLSGLLLENWLSENTRNLWLVAATLLFGSGIFWLVEYWSKRKIQTPEISFRTSLIVGLAQVLALVPGISRSGATIVAGLFRKLDRASAGRFAFLISLPVIAGASLLKLTEIAKNAPIGQELVAVVVGVLASMLAGYLVIKYFLKFLQKHSLSAFAWYRVLAALVIAVYLLTS
ncbi:undecaprenyl-diphosphatase UppP [Candidatus Parcubacteria bacterium]|jgi:undecaprenyl-diphosphatase|nr:MAG: undecaprenyl-diphosphatase UppP [Candidatus Parcubacteria bacterium]